MVKENLFDHGAIFGAPGGQDLGGVYQRYSGGVLVHDVNGFCIT